MFSELVDEIVTASGRRDRRTDIEGYVNATIRECQVQAFFYRDMIEDQLAPAGADPYTWDLPVRFRQFRTIQYPGIGYPKNLPPGRIQEDQQFYYYISTTYTTFVGAGALDVINIAYYGYLKRLIYYADGARPAVYDTETETWTYLLSGAYVSTLGTAALDLAARDKVSNWMTLYWYHAVKEGTYAKFFNIIDDPRAPKHYALFMKFKADVLKGEAFDSANF